MPNNPRAVIAAEVLAEMGRQRKTHEDLAGVLGVTKQSVSLRLREGTPQAFRAEELIAVADWLQVPITQFTTPARERAAS